MEKLIRIIQNANLTKKEKMVAEYFFKNTGNITFLTVSEIAKEVGVSDSTVIRFAHTIGFKSFNELKNYIQQSISQQMKSYIEFSLLTPTERLEKNYGLLEQNSTEQLQLDHVIASLKDVILKNPDSVFDKAAQMLINSKKKYIVGYRTSAASAEFMSFVLNLTLPNVIGITSGDAAAIESLLDIDENDCVVLFSFSRYSKICSMVRDIALENKAKLITISDKATAPATNGADIFLSGRADSLSFYNSPIPAIFIAEILCTKISKEKRLENENRLDIINRFLAPDQLY